MLHRIRRSFPVLLGFAGIFLLALGIAHAQVTTADILGTVTDPSGAIVAKGTVTATDEATGVKHTVQLTSSGGYDLTELQIGSYQVKITAPGFKTFVSRVTLAAGDRARVDAHLSVGSTSETVTVEAATPALQTNTSTVGTLISSQLTQNLPLNGRNVTNLIQLAAGVTGGLPNSMNSGTRPDDRRPSSSYSANGQSDEVNNNMIDGMDNNERFIGSVGVRPSIDAIQEVRVLTNLYTAEISRSGGAVVDLITKSGSNRFHGTAYEFLRNDITDARNYFATVGPRPELRQNQFGGSIGGPIVRDKAFFFFDYEDLRLVQGVTAVSTVPTLFEEQNPGNFTDLGSGCPNVSASVVKGSIGDNYFSLYPKPNVAVAIPGSVCTPPANNFDYTTGETQDVATYDTRVDYHITPKDSMYARYTYNNTSAYIPGDLPVTTVAGITVNPGAGPYGAAGGNSFAGPASDQETSAALAYTRILSPDSVLELHAQYMRLNNLSGTVNQGKDISTEFGFPCNAASCVNLPGDSPSSGLLSFSPDSQPYAALGDASYVPLLDQNNTFQYMAAYSLLKGPNSFKFGASLIRRQVSEGQSPNPRGLANAYGTVTGNDLADLLEGYVSQVDRAYTIVTAGFRAWEDGIYAEDDYRVNPNLTLNLGVRYDIYTPFTSANYGFTNFDPALGLLIGPGLPGAQKSNATAGIDTDYSDFAPRLGVDYVLRPGLVIRGGYGMTYFPTNSTSGSFMRNAPYSFSFSCGAPPQSSTPCTGPYASSLDGAGWSMASGIPVPSSNIALATNPANYIGTSINSTAFDYKNGLLQQYTVNIEKSLRGNVATVAWVGNHGSRLPVNGTNSNQPAYAGAPYPYPSLPGVTIDERISVLRSNYNALQLSLERRLRNGLAANVNYTWSHNDTNAQVLDEGQSVGNCVGPCHVDNGSGQPVVYNSYYQYDYGNADLDTRSRLALTMSYDLPFGNNLNGLAGGAAKGWSMNAIYYANTGNPITVQNSNARSGIPGLGNDRPNRVPHTTPGFHPSIKEWYDVTQFHAQAPGLLGDEARNSIYGPGSQSLSFSVFKTFPIHEQAHLEFRLESFNLLNTPTFSAPNGTIYAYDSNGVGTTGSGAGSITGTPISAQAREFQTALKFIF
ncbi:MAG: TonB-dependent receptor [Acidobacteriaceae bacterium]